MLQVVKIQATHIICGSGDPVQQATGNAGLTGAGENGEVIGSGGPARVKGYSVWDDAF